MEEQDEVDQDIAEEATPENVGLNEEDVNLESSGAEMEHRKKPKWFKPTA